MPCPAYCLYIAAVVRVQWRLRHESRPASAHIQEELVRVSRAMEWGVPDIAATEEFLPDEVRVMPSLPGPASVAVGPCMLLLDREDYDAETLEAIFRYELAHTHGVKATGLRSMCASGQWCDRAMSSIRTRVGSVFAPAPIELTTGMSRSRQDRIRPALGERVSIASTT